MTTALDIITGGAKLLGLIFKSEVLAADEASDGLVMLNDMLDTWSNDNLSTFVDTLENFSLTGASSYTMGTSGNFNTTRPINLLSAVVRVASTDYPLRIITEQQYQTEIAVKSITSSIPEYLTYDNGYPLATIKMFTIPTSGSTLYLQSKKPLSNLATLTTSVDLPPGWKRALKYNWAVSAGAEYGVEVPLAVAMIAKESLGAIRRAASINNAMPLMPSLPQYCSIYSGTE